MVGTKPEGVEEWGTSEQVDAIVRMITSHVSPRDVVAIMSNGGFGGIHKKLVTAIQQELSPVKTCNGTTYCKNISPSYYL